MKYIIEYGLTESISFSDFEQANIFMAGLMIKNISYSVKKID